ncbi:MAG TPA: cell envelope integrity protein TolA [Steroidobacteraceae bacterium]|nr:cell envelope integrity protein TolA [Steroidobacteraceae bacterium]
MAATAQSNVRYVGGALFLHAAAIGLIVLVSMYSPRIVVPQLGIKASLVSSNTLYPPKPQPPAQDQSKILEQQKEQQQEQLAQQKQKEQEEQLRIEQEKQKQAEQQRIAEAQQQAKRQQQIAEQKRVEAIKQKQREIEQRLEAQADARAQAKREADLKAQLAEEEGRDEAISSGLQNQYAALIRQRVERNWIKPPSAQSGIKCEVQVTQAMGGMVLSVSFGKCNGDAAVRQSIENAVMRSSPLPPPSDPRLFDRHLSFIFNPTE